ncbi:MAG: serine/threonine protein kinase [Pirellulales bacterium]|nr:serine/threonine protein kinase [Pirellulales bacterium]
MVGRGFMVAAPRVRLNKIQVPHFLSTALMEFERLGPYRIVGKLGRGGMGTVFEAVHQQTGEKAAVKLLSAALAEEEGFRVRFEAEIETLRKLNHPNIVRLYGFGEQEGHLFYSMELVVGNSLEEELRGGRRFDWREVARIGVETCRALRHAHDRGVIHRDIKPGNLLLAAEGSSVKLSDFGIARLFGNTRLTSAGNVLGTAEYMAPEQAEGRPVDARADLYSLGALLYALLARRPVFRGKSLPEMLHKHRFERPEPVRKYAPDVPAELERILGELLEKDPARRIPNADILARRLEAMSRALSIVPETMEADAGWFFTQQGAAGVAAEDDVPVTRELTPPGGGRAVPAPPEDEQPPTNDDVPPPSHFVEVSEEELGQIEEEEPPPLFSWHTGVLVGALILVALTIWWFLQPPSADSLYERIAAATADGKIESIVWTEDDIRDFLNRYSNDPRAAEIRKLDDKIDLYNLEQKFNRRLKGRERTDNLQPIDRAYLDAIRSAEDDKELCAKKLRAIIDLFGQRGDNAAETGQCLTLARRRLSELNKEIEKYAVEQLELLGERLDAADELAKSDPRQAQKMYQAAVLLYGDKPWAATVVRRARDALDK